MHPWITRTVEIPKLDCYFEIEKKKDVDEVQKENTLKECIRKTKEDTCKFEENLLLNNYNMIDKLGRKMNKINSAKSI